MNTAQLSGSAPRFVTDIKPPAAFMPQRSVSTTAYPEPVQELPVREPAPTYQPVMTASLVTGEQPVHAEAANETVPVHIEQQNHQPIPQPAEQAKNTHVDNRATKTTERKPIPETVAVVVLCLVSCFTVIMAFGR